MSRRTYELSAAARLDLLDVWNYLADAASLDVADKVAENIEEAIGQIAKSPEFGHRRPDLTSRNILFYRVHSYLVIYRPDTKPLHVIRILHAARDVKRLLQQ
jgi:plasmid stabilization system protein ParE